VLGVFVDHGLAEVERNQFGAQVLAVQALNDGVIPVDLVDHAAHAVGDVYARLGNHFSGQRQIVGLLLGFFDRLDLGRGQALGLEAGGAVLHQLVLAAVVLGGDERFAVGDQVLHAHAGHEGVAQRLGHSALQRDGVGKCGADGQKGQHIAVSQRLAQAFGIEHEVADHARRAGLLRIDAFNQGFCALASAGTPPPSASTSCTVVLAESS